MPAGSPSLHLQVHFLKLKEKTRAAHEGKNLKVVSMIGSLTVETKQFEVGKQQKIECGDTFDLSEQINEETIEFVIKN